MERGSFDLVLIWTQLNLRLLPWLPWQPILIADRSYCDFKGKIISCQCTKFQDTLIASSPKITILLYHLAYNYILSQLHKTIQQWDYIRENQFSRRRVNMFRCLCWNFYPTCYGKCPKIMNIKMSDKMAYANSAGPDQTAPEGAVWSGSTMFAIPLSVLRNCCIKSKV